jgi:hypothetical protein
MRVFECEDECGSLWASEYVTGCQWLSLCVGVRPLKKCGEPGSCGRQPVPLLYVLILRRAHSNHSAQDVQSGIILATPAPLQVVRACMSLIP